MSRSRVARLGVLLLAGALCAPGCATLDEPTELDEPGTELDEPGTGTTTVSSDPPPDATGPQPTRLEEKWGPGEFAALLTGTHSSKDRNLAFNIPLLTWYVREKHRKGLGILGGAIAYDMVTTQFEQGEPVSRRLLSHGLLGIMGNLDERRLDGTGYRKTHWFFPFYRYHNVNGQRAVYPLFFIPVPLRDDPTPPALDPAPWDTAYDDNLDPDDVDPVRPPDIETRRPPERPELEPAPSMAFGSTPRTPPPRRTQSRTPGPARPEGAGARQLSSNQASGGWKSETPSRQYRVRKGDTLYRIARQEYGDVKMWRKIYSANQTAIPNPDAIREGLTLVLP